jgi:hypothetical protein
MDASYGHVLVGAPYPGNGWWVFVAGFSVLMLVRNLLGFRQKRASGQSVAFRDVIAVCLFLLGFFIVAIYQVLSHQ